MNDILFGNNNQAVLKRLSGRYFKANKSRNMIAVVAIVLTTTLFAAIFTLGFGMMDTIHDQNIRKAGGDGQAVLSYINDSIYEDVKGSPLIDRIAYTKCISYKLKNPGLEKWRAEVWYMDDTMLDFARYEPTEGQKPTADREIMADTKTLEALGIPARIGETVSLSYEMKGKEYHTDFTLCGFWETDSLSNVGRLLVSKAFMDSHAELGGYTHTVGGDYTGSVAAYIMFKGNGDPEAKLQQLLSETGYTCDTMGGSAEDPNYIIARISPAYTGGNLLENPAMLISGIAGILLIIVAGYLIIYNIFQISVIQDIQSYGQLKTLGITKRQIKRLISGQVLRLSLIGIPIGLLFGFLIGRALVPFLMNGTSYTSEAGIKVTANPYIFIGSAVFALITVFISVRRPARIAGMVSPIEAIRYTENDPGAFGKKSTDKKSTKGAKIHRMALANLGRNRRRTVLVLVSMTLSLVLFNTVFTLAAGFDIDKYISKFMDVDFLISSADYFQYRFERSEYELSESFIEAARRQDSFEDGGRLYTSRILEEAFSASSQAFANYNKDTDGNPYVDLYGADEFLLDSMEVIEGTIDWQAFASGDYVLFNVECGDNGNVIDNPEVNVGDKIRFNHLNVDGTHISRDRSFDLTVMAKVRTNENTATTRHTGASRFYLPTERFRKLCDTPHLVGFPFNVKDGRETEMEEFLGSYVENTEPNMDFDSRGTYKASFDSLTSLIVTIGGALSVLIGFIGIANFINSVLTSILTRRKEFAMLQSIGMTGKQLKSMLSYEGLYYAVGTVAASVVFGGFLSLVIVRGISASVWFFTYHFVAWPMLVLYPFLFILTVTIPVVVYRRMVRASIIERLRLD